MSKDIDIQAIADLARIKVDKEQEVEMRSSITSVLEFVAQIQSANVSEVAPKDFFRLTKNRLRPDQNPTPAGTYTDEIMRVAPKSKDNYFQIKKIINKED